MTAIRFADHDRPLYDTNIRDRSMTYEQQVKLWLVAVEKSAKKILSSKRETPKFMQRVGIVDKGGKQLAKRYR